MPFDPITALATVALALATIGFVVAALFIVRAFFRRSAWLARSYNLVTLQVLVPKEGGEDDATRGGGIEKVREAIAKTEAFFTTIGGLRAERGFRAWLTGRGDHFSFEIVAHRGQLKFFIAVPSLAQAYLEDQLHAQSPDAFIEPAKDYNIFSPQGHIVGTTFAFKRPSFFPIRTYKTMESDPLDALVSAMGKIAETDGAAIQYVVRSARREWRAGGISLASKMQQGKSLKKSQGTSWKDIAKSSFASSAKQSESSSKEYRLSPMEEQVVKGLEEKAAKAGLDVNIRIVVSSDDTNRAAQYLQNIAQSFASFNVYEYGNMLVGGKPSTSGSLIRQFIFRQFDESRRMVLNTEEIAGLWHLPLPTTEAPNIEWLIARRLPPPVNLPQEGVVLGETNYRGQRRLVRLKRGDRRRHMYTIGTTGVGKTTIMENMAIQDIRAGEGVGIIDPHGEFAEHALRMVPKERADDVIYFDPSDMDRPVGLNLLEAQTPEEMDYAAQEMVSIFYKLVSDPQMIGPMFEHYIRNAMLTLMSDPANPGTLVEIPRILMDPAFQKLKLRTVTDPLIRAFWEKELPQTSGQTKGEMLPYLVSKIGRFIENTMVRNIVGQQRSGLNFREAMDKGKIIIVNLSKGKIGEMPAKLFGLLIVTKLQMAALARADMPEEDRRDFYLYMDEFQNFVTDSIATILSEARKYKLNLILAHQYISQLVQNNDSAVRDAVFGNVGTVFAYRIGVDDSETIAKQLGPPVNEFDVMNIEKFNGYVRLMMDNTAQRVFNMRVLPPAWQGCDDRYVEPIRQLSRLKFGRDRVLVEAEIMERSQIV
ncbi:MAG: type IV secretion system DNA-binding domain-containing protein [Candidatus Uhrbacteria bacterium]